MRSIKCSAHCSEVHWRLHAFNNLGNSASWRPHRNKAPSWYLCYCWNILSVWTVCWSGTGRVGVFSMSLVKFNFLSPHFSCCDAGGAAKQMETGGSPLSPCSRGLSASGRGADRIRPWDAETSSSAGSRRNWARLVPPGSQWEAPEFEHSQVKSSLL